MRFCKDNGVPFVYDLHHHCCLPDNLNIDQVTEMALKTGIENCCFIFPVLNSVVNQQKNLHYDYINIKDFPDCWRDLDITIKVEAKSKELAAKRLAKQLITKS